MKKEFEKEQKDNQIDDMFLDMPDMDDDEKFCQWLEEEYQKEADTIEEALFAGRKYEDNQDIAERLSVSRESFYKRLKEEGLSGEEAEEKKIPECRKDTDISDEEQKSEGKIVSAEQRFSGRKRYSHVRLGRIAGIAGVCLICVFAASMSSEANRKYLVNSVRILSGNDSQFITDNEESNERASTEESDAFADIEEKLGVKLPEFYYRPNGMEFLDYEVEKNSFFAEIEYKYNDSIIPFCVDKQDVDVVSNITSSSGEEKIIDIIDKEGYEVTIKEVKEKNDEYLTYVAQWTYRECLYSVSGKIELEELKEIINEMKF